MTALNGQVIGVDLRSACHYPGHGIGTYTAELFGAMPRSWRGFPVVGEAPDLRVRPGQTVAPPGTRRLPGSSFWDLAARPASLRGDEILWHNPHNGLGAPAVEGGLRLVLTLHDLIPLILPDTGRQSYARAFAQQVPGAAAAAQAVITASEHSRQDAIRVLGLAPDKIHVIAEAARSSCRPMPKDLARRSVSLTYGLKHPYVLYVGGFGQRKNVASLIKGFAQARRRLPRHSQLAITGSPERTYGQVHLLAHRLGCANDVVFLNHVPEVDLVALYSAAAVFVYPSLYEGFGLPPLEAMACGCPVVCSDATSLPEVCGAAAVLVDAKEPQDIGEAIAGVMNDHQLASELGERGLARAAQFSWQRAAAQTVEVYGAVLASNESPAEGCT